MTNTYNFPGELLTSTREHWPGVTGSPTLTVLTRHEYNGIGQLMRKRLHSENGGTNFIDTVGYQYNERGWNLRMASSHFTQSLRYQDPSSGTAQYNGNIAQQNWRHGTGSVRNTVYVYDGLNRLKDGNSANGGMREQLAYDDMGNITNLKRDNHATGISYTYTGNRLTSLSGQLSGSYTYDGNGNATKDRMNTDFTYSHLNLPRTAIRTGADAADVTYIYDALGTKLRRTATVSGTTTQREYIAGIEYSKVGSGASAIEMVHTEEGYLQRNSNNTYTYHYHLTDHLGNVRAVLQRTTATTGTVIQKQDYYPFGKTKAILTGGINKYLYNGKEVQGELGNQLDYGARFYDAEIGRWNVVDPLAEMFEDVSPYNYGMNNPILMVDPTGMAADTADFFNQVIEAVVVTARKVDNLRWPTWTYDIPVLGAAAESGNNLVDGNYGASLANFGTSLAELFTAGYLSQYRIGTNLASQTIKQTTKAVTREIVKDAKGNLTDGVYTVSKEAMKKHVVGGVQGKSIFYPTLDAEKAVLKAAQKADELGAWVGNKAKVTVTNTNVGTLGNGQPTNVINVYKNSKGTIHGAPGN